MKSDTISRLQEWYISNCDDDWEHSFGVTIGTLDNPGWSVSINLAGTPLEEIKFDEYSYGVGDEVEDDWIGCRVMSSKGMAGLRNSTRS